MEGRDAPSLVRPILVACEAGVSSPDALRTCELWFGAMCASQRFAQRKSIVGSSQVVYPAWQSLEAS